MKTLNQFRWFVWVACFVLGTHAAWTQPNYRVTLYATDGVMSDSVVIGLWSGATYGIDTIVVAPGDTIKEAELPPAPLAGNFNFRSADLPGQPRATGQGLGIDLRGSVGNPLQLDTIRLEFQSSDALGAGNVTFSWRSDLYTFGYGGFRLEDGSGLPVPLFQPVDMTNQPSFQHPIADAAHNQYVNVIIGTGYRFRTFAADSIAMAVDSKGKRNAEKVSGSGSEWTLKFTIPPGVNFANGVLVSFSQNVTQWYTSVTIDPPARPSLKVFHLLMPISNLGQDVILAGKGAMGKFMTASLYPVNGFNSGVPFKVTKLTKSKIVAIPTYQRVTLKQPNINNILNELYVQGHYPIDVGMAASFKRITQIKPADVIKTMAKLNRDKTWWLHTNQARCFKSTEGSYKFSSTTLSNAFKDAPPDKYNNRLVAEQLALKINLLASATQKTPVGLNLLQINTADTTWDYFNGMNLDQLAARVDLYASNCDSASGAFTGDDLADLLHAVNTEFSAVFDTAGGGFTQPHGGKIPDKKNGSTWLLGVHSTLMSSLLKQVVADVSPVILGKNYHPGLSLPDKFTVRQNYPNPFNPMTTIEFTLPEDALVTVKVYNVLGQQVATLADHEQFSEGENSLRFNGANLASGVYFYRVIVNDGTFQEVKKMMLMK